MGNKKTVYSITTTQQHILLGLLLFLYVYLCLLTAWLCDDAFITFRTMDHVVHGYGLTWNAGERVQAYTHPLWLFVVTTFYFFTREVFYTVPILSMVISVFSIIILCRKVSVHGLSAIVALAMLVFSTAFIEYSTSGLENALSHLLLVFFFWVYWLDLHRGRSLFLLSLLAALALCNRMDLFVLLFLPMMYAYAQGHSWKTKLVAVSAFFPFVLWLLFSLIYYGFPFPNTAYAKMFCIEAPLWSLLQQGGYYFLNSLMQDPLTLVSICSVIGITAYRGSNRERAVAVGVLLYLLFILKAGGGFMSGRFFTVPLLVAACLLGRIPFDATRWRWLGALGVILMLGLIPVGSPLKSNRHYGEDSSQIEYAHNIFNERAHYYPKTGMLAPKPWDLHIFRHSSRPAPKLAVEERIGMKGFLAGPRTYILDYAALANPLLARLPAIQYPGSPSFRIGHFYRCIPDGYIATILEGKNLIQDDSLHTYYEVLETITRGPVWSANRFAQIVKINLGNYDHLIDRDFYRSPPVVHRHLSDLETLPDNALWIDPRLTHFSFRGVEINLGQTRKGAFFEIGLDQYGDYWLSFMRNNEKVFEVKLGLDWDESASLAVYRIQLPPDIVQQGYDSITIKPIRFSNRHALGRVTIQGDQ